MSIGPTSPEARRGFDTGSFTQSKRQEQIHRLWAFLDGLSAKSINLTAGAALGDLLVVGENGKVEGTTSPGGSYTFPASVTFELGCFFQSGLTAGSSVAPPSIQIQTGAIILTHTAGSQQYIQWVDNDNLRTANLIPATISGDRVWTLQNLTGKLVVVGDDAPAVADGGLGKVDLTAQVANIATTALSNTPPAGIYEVEVYLMTTTADAAAGTLAVTIGWTDAVGATTSNVIATHALTATGRSTGRQIVNLASGNVTYAVTITGGYGTSAYAVAVRVVSLG